MGVGLNAMEIDYEEIRLLNRTMLFTHGRINRSTLPKGIYAYDVRHDDEMQGYPCEIADRVLVNHWGTIVTNEPIRLRKNVEGGYAHLLVDSEKDWSYEGEEITLQEFMRHHPPKKARRRKIER